MRLSPELRQRTKAFGSKAIGTFIRLPRQREEVRTLARQLLRAATSVAAHAREASRARSDNEFCSKIDVLLQEADESQLWIEYLIEDCELTDPDLKRLHTEAEEILAIFTTIVSKTRKTP